MKWAEDRLENFLSAYQGRGIEADVELAVSSDGRLLGVRARLYADLGAYLVTTTPVSAHTAALLPHRRLRHPGRRGDDRRRTHEQGPDWALPRRRAPSRPRT